MEQREQPAPLPDFKPTERITRQAQDTDGLVVAGYLTSVLVPIVGFFIGFALVLKNRFAHGVTTMILSVVASVLVAAVLLQ